MSRSLLSSPTERSWLERPIHYDRVPLQPRRSWVTAIEIALLTAVILVITIEVIF
jgi:hypothetical protein